MAVSRNRLGANGRAAAQKESKLDPRLFEQIVENTTVRVVVPDGDLGISYINPPSFQPRRRLEHLLPCRVEELIGKSIDIFHKNPEHQRRILSDPKNLPHRAQIKLGDE